MTFASVSAVTVTLLLVGVFVMIMMNLNKVADDLERDVEVKIYVELTASEEDIAKLQEDIKNIPGVAELVYATKGEELKKLVMDFGSDLELYEQENPLHNVFYAKAVDPQETEAIAKEIDKLDNTFEVSYGEGKIERLFSVLNMGRNVGVVLILALLFTAMFLISNTIRITIVARRRDIEIMKLVGATNWFIRIPFILEGMWLGILGAIVPITLVTVLYYNLYNALQPKLELGNLFNLLEFSPFIYQLNALILLMGVLIGIWGSFMSVRKFLRV